MEIKWTLRKNDSGYILTRELKDGSEVTEATIGPHPSGLGGWEIFTDYTNIDGPLESLIEVAVRDSFIKITEIEANDGVGS